MLLLTLVWGGRTALSSWRPPSWRAGAMPRRWWEKAGRTNALRACVRQEARDTALTTLRAFAAVQGELPEARLTFVGDGALRSELAAAAARDGIAGVTFAGEVSDPSPFYLECNVMVLPSLSEGLPYTLIEAAARG